MSTLTLPWEQAETGMHVAWVEHDLYVDFEGGSKWKFINVPRHFYTDMLNAANSRRYFRAHIMGRFDPIRLEAP